uniref:Uncharacterized protein n=1 Tax=Acrobeloides nanus TaxID=290746 RepID=A0A914BZC5_9BILA
MFAVTTFFDVTPTGRILNRFSKDMDEIDVKLPFSSEALLQYMLTSLGFLLMISWIFPFFLIPCIPLAVIFILFFLCFRSGIRSLKRTENISRSPLFDHVLSLDGLLTIHSFGQTGRFVDTFKSKLDENSGAMFMFHSAMRWQAVWLDLLVVAVTFFVSLFIVVLTPDRVTPANAGMALAFALQMSGIFQFAVRSQTELEAKLTAVERISHYYKEIEEEKEYESAIELPKSWPSQGNIVFDDVSLKYSSNSRLALNNVSFKIEDGEKVGVVGRTGSGKSSLCNSLYRMYPLNGGKILINDRDISQVGLRRLRRSMAIIPQDPVLFAETLRFNIDPEQESADNQIWECLEKTGLKNTVSMLADQLDFKVEEGGSNLSSGQRQLICIARALLRDVKIVLIDEATANLDINLDSQVQKCIRETFVDKTILLITHRLNNVADMDTILRVDDGNINVEKIKNTSSVNDTETIENGGTESTETTTSPSKSINLYPTLSNDSADQNVNETKS